MRRPCPETEEGLPRSVPVSHISSRPKPRGRNGRGRASARPPPRPGRRNHARPRQPAWPVDAAAPGPRQAAAPDARRARRCGPAAAADGPALCISGRTASRRPFNRIATRVGHALDLAGGYARSRIVRRAARDADQLAELDNLARIEAVGRLVEHQQIRVVQQGLGEQNALPVTAGQPADDVRRDIVEGSRARAPSSAALHCRPSRPLSRPMKRGTRRPACCRRGARPPARNRPDGAPPVLAPRRRSRRPRRPALGTQIAGQDPQDGRLPEPFGPRRPRTSPAPTSKETSSTPTRWPYCLVRCSARRPAP